MQSIAFRPDLSASVPRGGAAAYGLTMLDHTQPRSSGSACYHVRLCSPAICHTISFCRFSPLLRLFWSLCLNVRYCSFAVIEALIQAHKKEVRT